MHKLMIVILIFCTGNVLADRLVGRTVQVNDGVLMCNSFRIDAVLVLNDAGNSGSANAYVDKGYCVVAREILAVVTAQMLSDNNYPIVQLDIKGESIWTYEGWVDCCYIKNGDEWQHYAFAQEKWKYGVEERKAAADDRDAEMEAMIEQLNPKLHAQRKAAQEKEMFECETARLHLKGLKGSGITDRNRVQPAEKRIANCIEDGY